MVRMVPSGATDANPSRFHRYNSFWNCSMPRPVYRPVWRLTATGLSPPSGATHGDMATTDGGMSGATTGASGATSTGAMGSDGTSTMDVVSTTGSMATATDGRST